MSRIGLIARADRTGLGNQTYEFYKHMNPAKTLVVVIDHLNKNESDVSKYPDATVCRTYPVPEGTLRSFLEGLDCVFTAEAPYNPNLYKIAREMGVKVANQYNYEFVDWFTPMPSDLPDILIAPSRWNWDKMQKLADDNNIQHVYLHCPVDRKKLKFRKIKEARTFLHQAGKSAAHDRNGTLTVIEASKYLKTDAKIVIKFQGEQGLAHQLTKTTGEYRQYALTHGDRSKLHFVVEDTPNYEDIYKLGDVLVLPRRYGGNCLPVNEALSCGMPVIMPDIDPNDMFLPAEWLVPAEKTGSFVARAEVDIYSVDPKEIAKKIDEFYLMDKEQMLEENQKANDLAESISWENMKERYEEVLCQ